MASWPLDPGGHSRGGQFNAEQMPSASPDTSCNLNFDLKGKQTATYSYPPFQGRDDFSHHPHQVLILVRVVREPHSFSDRQDLFADEPGLSRKGLSAEPASLGGSGHLSFSDRVGGSKNRCVPAATEGNRKGHLTITGAGEEEGLVPWASGRDNGWLAGMQAALQRLQRTA